MKKYLFILLLVMIFASCADKPLVIVQVADAQLGFDAAIKGQQPGAVYVNDLSYEAEYLRKAVTVINELSPDVVIYTGDQVNIVDNEEQWQLFTEIISGIDADILQLHIPGNHDVAFPDGKVKTVRAAVEGIIGYEEKGENGFGYDPIFYLPEYGCTTAELDPEIKNKISHRGNAIRALVEKLKNQ